LLLGCPERYPLSSPPPEPALAIVISVWLSKVAVRDFDAVVLAPPILERYLNDRLVSREVVDFGLDWPLPAPNA
jgi:hypothetical protein